MEYSGTPLLRPHSGHGNLVGGRINEGGSHCVATRFKHVLHMNTFNSAIIQSF